MSTVDKQLIKRYNEFTLPGKGTIMISKSLQAQIDYLHEKVGSIEWSGFLFYKVVSGSLDNPSSLVIRAENIYLLDIGSSAYTSREGENGITQEEVINMYETIPGAEDEGAKYGFIHTHHSMDAFFSGTDRQELHDNVDTYGILISLIVNFKGNYCCKAAFKSTITSSFDSFGKKKAYKQEVLGLVDFNVVKEDYQVPTFLMERYKKVREDAYKKTVSFSGPANRYPYGSQGSLFSTGGGARMVKGKDESAWEKRKEEEEEPYFSWKEKEEGKMIGMGLGRNLKRTGTMGKSQAFVEGTRKSNLKAEITNPEAVEIINDWLKRGISQLVDVDSPQYDFPGIDLKVLFLDNYFNDKSSTQYTRFVSDMQDHLIDASAHYKPSVISHRLSEYLKNYSSIEVAKDLVSIASSHDNYCKAVLPAWIL